MPSEAATKKRALWRGYCTPNVMGMHNTFHGEKLSRLEGGGGGRKPSHLEEASSAPPPPTHEMKPG